MIKILPLIMIVLLLAGCDNENRISRAEYQRQVEAKEKAQFFVALFAAASVITLIIGVALGSKAADE